MKYLALFMGSFNIGAVINSIQRGDSYSYIIIECFLAISLIGYFIYEEFQARKHPELDKISR